MVEIPFVVFLFLNSVHSIFSSDDIIRDVKNIVFTFFLIIRWVWNSKFLYVSLIEFVSSKFGPAVLKTDTV